MPKHARKHAHKQHRQHRRSPKQKNTHEQTVLPQTLIPTVDAYGHPLPPLRDMAAALHEGYKILQAAAQIMKDAGEKNLQANHVYALISPALDVVYATSVQLDDMQGVARAYSDASSGESRQPRCVVEVPADVYESVQSASTRLDALMRFIHVADGTYKVPVADICALLEPIHTELVRCYEV